MTMTDNDDDNHDDNHDNHDDDDTTTTTRQRRHDDGKIKIVLWDGSTETVGEPKPSASVDPGILNS